MNVGEEKKEKIRKRVREVIYNINRPLSARVCISFCFEYKTTRIRTQNRESKEVALWNDCCLSVTIYNYTMKMLAYLA